MTLSESQTHHGVGKTKSWYFPVYLMRMHCAVSLGTLENSTTEKLSIIIIIVCVNVCVCVCVCTRMSESLNLLFILLSKLGV